MEKEKVLEIEFKEIWGKYAWRIVKNKIPFNLNLSEVFNKEVKLVAHNKDTIYIFYDLGGTWDVLDEEILIYENDKIQIENFVKEINSKYGIPKRWRANKGELYYIIDSMGRILDFKENYDTSDNEYYELGNYFKTKDLATKFKDTIWKNAYTKIKNLI